MLITSCQHGGTADQQVPRISLGVYSINVDQADLDSRKRRIMGLTLLLVGMQRDGPSHLALFIIPTFGVLHVEGFTQGSGQFLPARHQMPGVVPIGELPLAEGDEQQGRVVIEQSGNGFDTDIQMHHGSSLRVQRQEVFAFEKVGGGRGKELAYQRLGQ
ncbi:hypothetical protein D3C84_611130 [compost metagenome]